MKHERKIYATLHDLMHLVSTTHTYLTYPHIVNNIELAKETLEKACGVLQRSLMDTIKEERKNDA
jgi:hypothetical protein